ncbi:universal stress protein [Novipirellula aureliae]|nr:universal stress protein [Novipirellula aureliae]
MSTPSVLCATDFSPASDEAVRVAVEESNRRGAIMDLVHVWYPVDPVASDFTSFGVPACSITTPLELRKLLEEIEIPLPPDRVRRHLEVGIASEILVSKARELGSEVMVVGTHAHGPLMRWFIGSVVSEVLRHSPCPVLVCRTPPKDIESGNRKAYEKTVPSEASY